MKRCILGLCLVFVLLFTLTACGGEKQNGMMLDNGWVMRGDSNGRGEEKDWHKGFTEANNEKAEINWYANSFSASFIKGDRILLYANDLGRECAMWLNGKQIDARPDATGLFYLDVSDAVKRNGKNVLVVRAKGNVDVDGIGLSVRPKMAVTKVKASVEGDEVTVTAVMDNSGTPDYVTFTVEMTAESSGKLMARVVSEAMVNEGVSEQVFTVTVPDHLKWDQDHAVLYHVAVKAQTVQSSDTGHTDMGFAILAQDEEGYYNLNGVTTFLRIADMPERVLANDTVMRRFVDYMRTAEFNAVCPLIAPTQALLDYCDRTGMIVLVDPSVAEQYKDSHVSLMGISVEGIPVAGDGLEFALEKPVNAVDAMYKELGLDRLYGGAVDLYKAMSDSYVDRVSDAVRDARKSGAPAVRLGAAVDSYPDSLLLPLTDGIEELRYVLNVDPVIFAGDQVAIKLDLVDVDILWPDTKFEAYIKITNDKGIVWDKKIPFTSSDSKLGHSLSVIELVDESVMIPNVGYYEVSVELTDLAHPVCGEADFYVVDRANLSGVMIVRGSLTDEAKAAAQAGGKVIVLNASAESGLPFEATFVDGITGAIADPRIKASFAGTAMTDMDGVAFDRAIQTENGTPYLIGFGLDISNTLRYGSIIATYPYGAGSITVVTADVDANNPVVAAALASAIA